MAMERLKVNPKKVYNRPFYHTVKRLFDIVASAIGLVLLSPLFLYLIIRLDTKMVAQHFIRKSELVRMKSHLECGSFVPWLLMQIRCWIN